VRSAQKWYEDIQSNTLQGEILYEVYAFSPADGSAEEKDFKIADVILDTPLHTSEWGDDHLFFRHFNVRRDRMYWTKAQKKLNEDPLFNKKDPANIWGDKVPDTWPSEP